VVEALAVPERLTPDRVPVRDRPIAPARRPADDERGDDEFRADEFVAGEFVADEFVAVPGEAAGADVWAGVPERSNRRWRNSVNLR
jgi:hypothetical protein